MQSIRPLIDKIEQKDSAIQAIEINGQIISSSESFSELDLKLNSVRYATDIGNNKALTIGPHEGSDTRNELLTIDLITKKVTTQLFDLPPSTRLCDFVVLDNPDNKYIALSVTCLGDYGNLLILNTETMKIDEYPGENIGLRDEYQSYGSPIRLHKYNGRLYGITADPFGPTFFTAPSTFNASFKLTNNIKMHHDVTGGDVAIDRSGYVFFPYQTYLLSLPCSSNSANVYKMIGNRSNVGANMLFMQQLTGASYLMYSQHHGDEIHVFQGDDNPSYGIDPRVQKILRFSKERIFKVIPLVNQEKSKLILVSTEKASYIYDLINNMMIGKIQNLTHNRYHQYVHAVKDGVLFDPVFGEYLEDTKMMLLTVCQMQQANELKILLETLKTNTSVKEIFINDVSVDAEILQILYELSQKPDLKLVIPKELQSMLNLLKINAAKDVASSAKIKFLEDAQQAQQMTIEQLHSSLTDLEKKHHIASEQFASERQAFQHTLTEQAAQSAQQVETISSLEHTISDQQEEFATKEQRFLEHETALRDAYQVDIVAVKMEIQTTSEQYEELYTQLSASSLPVQSLSKRIYQADELDEGLCQELIDPQHDIKELSLIRWSDRDELKHVKEDLEQRGAIFHVNDLVKKIKQIEPPYDDKKTLKSFTKAIERLELDYKHNVLPQPEAKSLIAFITPDIQKDMDTYSWLQELYFPETELIKNHLVEKFLLSEVNTEIQAAVEREFLRAVDDILNNPKYKHHHARLRDANLLSLIRSNENKSDPLVLLIIKMIDVSNINLTAEQEASALRVVLENPTDELNRLIDIKIIQFCEKLKESVEPSLVKIQELENKVKVLEQKEGVTHVAATMFSTRQEHNQAIPHPLPLRRSQSWP